MREYEKSTFLLLLSGKNFYKQSKIGVQFITEVKTFISVFRIELPPLRQRKEDILPLAQLFIERYAKQVGCPAPVLSSEVKNLFLSYP